MDVVTPEADFREPPVAYRPETAARTLDVSLMTINNWLRDGRLRARKAGGVTLILRSDIMTMIETLPDAVYAPRLASDVKGDR